MKIILSLSFFIFLSNLSFSQSVNCDSLALVYNKKYEVDSLGKEFFCKGVDEALSCELLVIRSIGDSGFASNCFLYSFELYGVKIEYTGDIVLYGQEDSNAGFNSVMIPRIKNSIGSDYDKLGEIDSSWVDLDQMEFRNEIFKTFYLGKNNTDSTFNLFIDSNLVSTTIFKSFEGLTFKNAFDGEVYTLQNLYKGIQLKKWKKITAYLEIDFTLFSNPNNICKAIKKYTIPINSKFIEIRN